MSDLLVGYYRTITPTERGIVFGVQFLHQQRMFRSIPGVESISPFLYNVQDHRNYIRVTASAAGHYAISETRILDTVNATESVHAYKEWQQFDRQDLGATWTITLASPMCLPYLERRTHYQLFFSMNDLIKEIHTRAKKINLWPDQEFDQILPAAEYDLRHAMPSRGDMHITDVYIRNNKIVRGTFGLFEYDVFELFQTYPSLSSVIKYVNYLMGVMTIGYRDLGLAVPFRPDLHPFLKINSRQMFLSIEPLGGYPILMPAG